MHPLIVEELSRQLIEDRLAEARRLQLGRRRYLADQRLRRLLGFALIRLGARLSATKVQVPAPTAGV